jgi:hypothetical protein
MKKIITALLIIAQLSACYVLTYATNVAQYQPEYPLYEWTWGDIDDSTGTAQVKYYSQALLGNGMPNSGYNISSATVATRSNMWSVGGHINFTEADSLQSLRLQTPKYI